MNQFLMNRFLMKKCYRIFIESILLLENGPMMIYGGYHKVPSHIEAYSHQNMTFSLILKRNQALIQSRSKYQHWKLSHDDIWWLPQVA